MLTKNFKRTFEFTTDLIITAERMVYNDLRDCKLIPISNSAFAVVSSVLNDDFNLQHIYVGLTQLTGHGDDMYDDYKGSFSFAFKLNVKKPNYETEYFYHVMHYRSYIEFFVHEIAPKDDLRDENIMHQASAQRFSDQDIRMFSYCFLKLAVMSIDVNVIEPFVKFTDSNLILFGYLDNKYFYKQFDNYEEYHNTKLVLEQQLQEDKINDLTINEL
jgi:hypothetical protein